MLTMIGWADAYKRVMIVEFLKERLGGSKPKASRAEVMAARPFRNPSVVWERETRDENAPPVAILKVPRRRDKFGNAVAKIFRLPEHRRLELDEIGSDVWELCDGDTPVEALTKAICDRYKLNRRQAETSVTAYLKMLAERNLIALRAGNRQSATGGNRGEKKQGGAMGTKRRRTI